MTRTPQTTSADDDIILQSTDYRLHLNFVHVVATRPTHLWPVEGEFAPCFPIRTTLYRKVNPPKTKRDPIYYFTAY